jgi:hypothetical protein
MQKAPWTSTISGGQRPLPGARNGSAADDVTGGEAASGMNRTRGAGSSTRTGALAAGFAFGRSRSQPEIEEAARRMTHRASGGMMKSLAEHGSVLTLLRARIRWRALRRYFPR